MCIEYHKIRDDEQSDNIEKSGKQDENNDQNQNLSSNDLQQSA